MPWNAEWFLGDSQLSVFLILGVDYNFGVKVTGDK